VDKYAAESSARKTLLDMMVVKRKEVIGGKDWFDFMTNNPELLTEFVQMY